MPPTKTLRALGLRSKMTFADVGCGPGYFALPACRVVGKSGKVLACDTSPGMLRAAKKQAIESGVDNLQLIQTHDPEIPFPDECAEMAMLGFVLHESRAVEDLLSEASRILAPGGRMIVMEWHPREIGYGPPPWARISIRDAKKAIRSAGLFVSRSWSFDDDTYFVVATTRKKRTGVRLFPSDIQKIIRKKAR